MMDQNNYNDRELLQEERIMSFLRGNMTAEEEAIFKNDLNNDPLFKEQAFNMAHLVKGLSQVGNENDEVLKESLLAADEETIRNIAKEATNGIISKDKPKRFSIKRKYVTILSVAASLLFVIYFGFLYNDYRNTLELGDMYAMKYESSVSRGDEKPEVSTEVQTLVDNVYYKRDLDKTLKRLAVLWDVSTQETYNDYTEYAPQIGWALATGYLKDNNKEDAMLVLERMSKLYDDNTLKGKNVKELLNKLNNI